jgi:hypothetical protein
MTAVMTTTTQLAPSPIQVSTSTAPVAAPLTATPFQIPVTTRGWHDDPLSLHALRFHDGLEWTEHVTHHGPVPCPGGCRPRA